MKSSKPKLNKFLLTKLSNGGRVFILTQIVIELFHIKMGLVVVNHPVYIHALRANPGMGVSIRLSSFLTSLAQSMHSYNILITYKAVFLVTNVWIPQNIDQ